MADVLHLALKGEYFDQIADGQKPFEYRLCTEYWKKRLLGRSYRRIVLTRGYPKGGGVEGVTRLSFPFHSPHLERIRHPHFGPDEVEVFAIPVGHKMNAKQKRSAKFHREGE